MAKDLNKHQVAAIIYRYIQDVMKVTGWTVTEVERCSELVSEGNIARFCKLMREGNFAAIRSFPNSVSLISIANASGVDLPSNITARKAQTIIDKLAQE
mgnify:CR=1 FL=1